MGTDDVRAGVVILSGETTRPRSGYLDVMENDPSQSDGGGAAWYAAHRSSMVWLGLSPGRTFRAELKNSLADIH